MLADFFSVLPAVSSTSQYPLHPHPYHHIRILHQRLDRIAAPVIADRLERRRRRQAGKPIAVGEHIDKRVDRLGMFDPP